jgi:hypothetical protein
MLLVRTEVEALMFAGHVEVPVVLEVAVGCGSSRGTVELGFCGCGGR